MQKKKPEIKTDGKNFERFDDLFRKVITVPKEELKRREEAEKQQKKEAKKKG